MHKDVEIIDRVCAWNLCEFINPQLRTTKILSKFQSVCLLYLNKYQLILPAMSDSELSSARSDIPDIDAATPATTIISRTSENLSGDIALKGKTARKRSADHIDLSKSRNKRSRTGPGLSYKEVDEEEDTAETEVISKSTPKKGRSTPKIKKTKVVGTTVKEEEVEVVNFELSADETPKKGTKRKIKVKKVVEKKEGEAEEELNENGTVKKKVTRKRKTKEEKEAEAMPLAARTLGSKILVGAHVSSAGGVHNTIINSVHIGGNALALFLKSQRKWANPALQDDHCAQFLSSCKEHKYDLFGGHKTPPIVPHGSYLVNLAHPAPDRTKQAYDSFIDDLDRCRKLGIRLYNFHPGNCAASSRQDGIKHLAKQLNKAHAEASSGSVITLLETMAGGGNVLGSTFEDLVDVISLIDDKERIGVCLDTCHVFAAGYDLRSPEAFKDTMAKFDKIVGLKYLRALHINDSKAPLSSHRDLHANIGTGFLGLRAFHNIVNEPRLWGLPMVLETPIDVKDKETGKEVPDKSIWAREIKLLESLVGMHVESEQFQKLEEELQSSGKSERDRVMGQVERREEKKAKASAKGKKGTKKKGKKEESSSDGSDEED
jgi:AP endonuclease-1